MISKISTIAFNGIETKDVEAQIFIEKSSYNFTIVGLADKTISESKERIRTSLLSLGVSMPYNDILANLAPADLIKEGSHFDLPIAVAILINLKHLPEYIANEYLIFGELSLNGEILPINGALPAAMNATGKNLGVICPKANGKECAWSGNKKILAIETLDELLNHFNGKISISNEEIIYQNKLSDDEKKDHDNNQYNQYKDIKDIRNQFQAKRALEIAAAGGHHMLMNGPPGSGKSMIAERLPSLLPTLNTKEILESTMISSVAGQIKNGNLVSKRPFRAPHHSCSAAAMTGGGMHRKIKPGEISLAHNGVLFLDELPEFGSKIIDSLRQPLETKKILISRATNQVTYPANFQLIAAMNPCKCGYLNDPTKTCSRAPKCGENYTAKISGPIMDRFDIYINVTNDDLVYFDESDYDQASTETSQMVANRVKNAREVQYKRNGELILNSQLEGDDLIKYAMPQEKGAKDLLLSYAKKFKLSMRSYNKILKVARTIADLDNQSTVVKKHISEALSYRKTEQVLT